MKQKKLSIPNLIELLSNQTAEEKLRIAFDLSKFVVKLREEGNNFEKTFKNPPPKLRP